ncbi:hypothetical protein NJ75_02547 [Novosphingobium subterraneum]|uniref:Uncharacterized protein n=1 Tax=Novosphingobium subterraneum TaxID=48936 RepID=A0A0B8ZH17_9SPHN|nr:hypothetical protein NJ75_02547 [Novosphingobium subterraneum]
MLGRDRKAIDRRDLRYKLRPADRYVTGRVKHDGLAGYRAVGADIESLEISVTDADEVSGVHIADADCALKAIGIKRIAIGPTDRRPRNRSCDIRAERSTGKAGQPSINGGTRNLDTARASINCRACPD